MRCKPGCPQRGANLGEPILHNTTCDTITPTPDREWTRDYIKVASPFVVFERDEVSTVAGSLLLGEASEAATAGAKRPPS